MMSNTPIDFDAAAQNMLSSDDALITVLEALYAAKGGFHVDPSTQNEEGTIALSSIVGSSEPAAREFADKSLKLAQSFYVELGEYRKDRNAWLAQQAGGVGESAMESADALSASLVHLVNQRYALLEEDIRCAALPEDTPEAIHQLFGETPMSGLLSAAVVCPALEQDQVMRLGCLLGMLTYITLKTPDSAPQDVSTKLSFFAAVLWSVALTQIKCGKAQDAASMQDAAVIALCMLCSYTYADSWKTQTACLYSLEPLTRLSARMLQALTDREMPAELKEEALSLDRLSPEAARLVRDHLIGTLSSAMPKAEDRYIEAQPAKLTQQLEKAWNTLILRHYAPNAPALSAAQAQTEEEDVLTETQRELERENGV